MFYFQQFRLKTAPMCMLLSMLSMLSRADPEEYKRGFQLYIIFHAHFLSRPVLDSRSQQTQDIWPIFVQFNQHRYFMQHYFSLLYFTCCTFFLSQPEVD